LLLLVLPLGTGWPSSRLSDKLLRWEVGGDGVEAGGSFNKGGFCKLFSVRCSAARLLLASCGGEGKKVSGSTSCRCGACWGGGFGAASF
jgi:hypothetical protein